MTTSHKDDVNNLSKRICPKCFSEMIDKTIDTNEIYCDKCNLSYSILGSYVLGTEIKESQKPIKENIFPNIDEINKGFKHLRQFFNY